MTNDGSTSSTHDQQGTGASSELVPNSDGTTISRRLQHALVQNFEELYIAGHEDVTPGLLVTNAIQGLIHGIEIFGTSRVDDIFKHVFDCASGLAGQSGKEEDVVIHLEKVVEYIQKTTDLSGNLLHCHILYRVAQVFTQQKHMEKAKRYFYSAQRIAASRRSELEYLKKEIVIWENLISIHDTLGEEKQLLDARTKYVEICEPILRSPTAWPSENQGHILVAVARACFEIGSNKKNEEQIKVGINYLQEALRLEKDKNIGASESGFQAWILLQLSEFYYPELGQREGQRDSWNYLEQAIAGLQQVECMCSSDSIDSSSKSLFREGNGMLDCACHQSLADAYIFQGRVLQHHGFMEEAQKSYELGLDLVEQCNDRKREAWFHLELAHHLFLKTHMYTNSCLHVEDSPQYTKSLFEQIVDHYRDFLKKYTPGVVFVHDQMAIYARAIMKAAEDPIVISNPNGFRVAHAQAIHKQLQMAEERVDYEAHAVRHECLSAHYYRMGDTDAWQKHLNLAFKYLVDEPHKTTPLRAFQTLGWISMVKDDSIRGLLESASHLWRLVFDETVKLQELMTGISEDHALRYFELSKRACMALVKCEILREQKSKTCPESQKPPQSHVESALIWAERGKGRMLMSFIEASTQRNYDEGSASQFDSRRFLTDDKVALNFICNTSQDSQSRKTIFVEHTFLDYHHVLIHLVIDDPCSGRTFVQDMETSCLLNDLPKGIRRQAEKYLDESLQDRSEAAQSSTGAASGAVHKVLSAMNKYSTIRKPFNPWIPGMVVGIQTLIKQANDELKDDPDSRCMAEKGAISELLQYLFQILIKPIKKQLHAVYKPGDTVVFVPHEDLSIVPFAALHESDGSRYLIEDYAISVSPSIWCTRHCQQLYDKMAQVSGCDEGAGPVLVGKKSGYPPGWNNLKQAHKEVDAVAEAMRSEGMSSTVLKDTSPDELSQARMMEVLPNASWIHLSVHGEVSSQFPQGSLLFSDNDSQRLTAEQIMTLAPFAWRARAVVASACQTGLGAVAGGGILGFARAFILAGVPSSVLTVWEAQETFCTEFMKKLYEELASGDTLAHAMQKTMILMKDRKKAVKHDRKGKGKVGKGEVRELKWTIFHWACLSCFGLPSVTLPDTEQRKDSS